VVALVIFLGYSSIPVAVLCGHGREYLKQVVEQTGTVSTPSHPR
jgi:hypothetical protein